MGIKINEYPLERLQFGDDDFYDIDYWNGSTFETAKIKGSTIKTAIQSGISGKNIYEDDDALTSDRTMDGANFKLLLEDMGQFRVKASNGQNDSVIFEVNAEINKGGLKGFSIKDQTTQKPKFEIFDGFIKLYDSYTLPKLDGAAGQVLTTDGAGGLSFSNVSTTDVNIYKDNGTLLTDRELDGDTKELYLKNLGKFIIQSIQSGDTNIEFEVLNQAGNKSFNVKDNSGNSLFSIENGKVKINGAYAFPTADGTNGQVLTTDGAGNVSFQTPQNSGVGGSGTLNKVAKWTPNGTTLGDSQIIDDSNEVAINKPITGTSRLIISEGNRDKTIESFNDFRERDATAIEGTSNGQKDNLTNIGVKGLASDSRPNGDTPQYHNIGVKGQGGRANLDAEPNGFIGVSGCAYENNEKNFGGVFAVNNNKGSIAGVGVYISHASGDFPLQIPTDAEVGTGNATTRVIACVTADGLADWRPIAQEIQAACSDETTPLIAANDVLTFRVPNDIYVTSVRISVTANASLTGTEVGVKVNNVNLFATNNVTIDAGELTSVTSSVNSPLDSAVRSITDDSEIKVSIISVATKVVTGLKITFIGRRGLI